jgi:FRG domain
MKQLGEVTSAAELVQIITDLASFLGYHYWWRGQFNQSWSLTPSVFRGDLGYRYETNVTELFVQRAPGLYERCPQNNDRVGWLTLMQHCGLPTRLMDWSESPLIGAYFAVNGLRDSPGAIWGLDPCLLNKTCWEHGVIIYPRGEFAKLFDPPFTGSSDSHKPAAIRTPHSNTKIRAQHGAFTIHGSSDPLESLSAPKEFLFRIDVPARAKSKLLSDLFALGIQRSTVFPDLENLAGELASMRFLAYQEALDP